MCFLSVLGTFLQRGFCFSSSQCSPHRGPHTHCFAQLSKAATCSATRADTATRALTVYSFAASSWLRSESIACRFGFVQLKPFSSTVGGTVSEVVRHNAVLEMRNLVSHGCHQACIQHGHSRDTHCSPHAKATAHVYSFCTLVQMHGTGFQSDCTHGCGMFKWARCKHQASYFSTCITDSCESIDDGAPAQRIFRCLLCWPGPALGGI